MKIFSSDIHRQHAPLDRQPDTPATHPAALNFECPARIAIVRQELLDRNIGTICPPEKHDIQAILRVHDSGYVHFLHTAYACWKAAGFSGEAIAPYGNVTPSIARVYSEAPQEFSQQLVHYTLTAETAIGPHTLMAALEAVDITLSAFNAVCQGDAVAFALCRPPGHHAPMGQFGGFCYFNNVAVAAKVAIAQGISRVAVLDIDYHHGNGTQSILETEPEIFFASLHADTRYAYPYLLGQADEIGLGAAEGTMANFPMQAYTADDVWREALKQALHKIKHFAPEILLVSLGVDTFEGDPIANFRLKTPDYLRYGGMIAQLGLPTVYVMEGGYNLDFIGVNVANVLEGHLQH